MSQGTRTIDVPVALPWGQSGDPDVPALSEELRALWIIEEVRRHRIGVGKGAELAGRSRAAFMSILGEHGVPVIDYPVEDLERELRLMGVE